MRKYNCIDLFSGCGGLSEGLKQAGFKIVAAIEIVPEAIKAYKLNHKRTKVISKDIRDVDCEEIKKLLQGKTLHMLAGCPPCQGFSSIRRLNRKKSVKDDRNNLVLEYLRFVRELKPLTIMMENVPGLKDYYLFKQVVRELEKIGYKIEVKVVNVKNYNVPQNRKRLIMVGSLLDEIHIAEGNNEKVTVRDVIAKLPEPDKAIDPLQKVVAKHTAEVNRRIILTPKDGGSWKDLPQKYILDCHKKKNVGFNDVYGRLRWDDYSATITGGCLNPSKGRFLHPEQNRVITPREAALLQSFPPNYKFPLDIPKQALALLIGNALPPKFSYYQSMNIKKHLDKYIKTYKNG